MAFSGILGVAPSSVSGVDASPIYNLGEVRFEDGMQYQYVYNDGNSQIPPGYGVCQTALSGFSVTISSVTGANILFGVVKHSTITTGAYGWVLKDGMTTVIAQASLSIGNPFVLGTDGAFSEKTISTGYTGPVCGITLQRATATGGSSYAKIRAY